MKFQDDISNMNTHKHTHTHTDKPKPICPPLFQSWGHRNLRAKILLELFPFVIHHGFCIDSFLNILEL